MANNRSNALFHNEIIYHPVQQVNIWNINQTTPVSSNNNFSVSFKFTIKSLNEC